MPSQSDSPAMSFTIKYKIFKKNGKKNMYIYKYNYVHIEPLMTGTS